MMKVGEGWKGCLLVVWAWWGGLRMLEVIVNINHNDFLFIFIIG